MERLSILPVFKTSPVRLFRHRIVEPDPFDAVNDARSSDEDELGGADLMSDLGAVPEIRIVREPIESLLKPRKEKLDEADKWLMEHDPNWQNSAEF